MKESKSTQEQEYQLIADYLAKLPSDHLLSKAKTDEQRYEWLRIRLNYGFLSIFWKTSSLSKNNPLDYIADHKITDPYYCEDYRKRINYILALWELIKIVEPRFKQKSLQADINFNYPFKSPLEMLFAFLEEEAEDEFLPCLENYYEKSLTRMKDMIQLGEKSHLIVNIDRTTKIDIKEQRNLNDIKKYERLERRHFPKERLCYSLFIQVCRIESNTNQSIKEKFIKFMNSFYELHKHIATGIRKRESATWQKLYSFAWKNGLKVPSGKGGAYHS